MADRMHQYPMFPQSLTPNSLQQPQIPQQPPQSQQPDPQMISALSNPEHSRMWQQLHGAYRPQQSGDLATPQMNPQMQEFARGPHGQPIVQQIQQSFGLNTQRMNPPVFHDTSQSQSLMPTNFANMPINTQQQIKAPFNMMHGLNNPTVSRQLKMHNQQEMARLQQSSLGAQHPSNQPPAVDMFVSSSMQPSQDQIHGSPHPAAQSVGPPGSNQGMMPGNPQQSVQKRIMTPSEFQERRNYLFNVISQSENTLESLLQAARNGVSVDPHLQQRLNEFRVEINNRKDMYNKFVSSYVAMMANPHVNHVPHSVLQQSQQALMSNTQVQPGFVTPANQSVPAQYNLTVGNGSPPLPAQGQSGALNQQIPIQPTPIGRPNTIPRTGGTPHQISGGQPPNTMSPNHGDFAIQGGQKVANQTQHSAPFLPLDKPRFESTYAHFCRSQNLPGGLRVTIGDNRMVDLHQLHTQVMHEGGAKSVTQREMWPIIGGRLGFIQFPGNESEPARCGPGLAQQLHNTYDQYLQHFENAYILTVSSRPTSQSPPQQMHQINPNTLPIQIGNSVTPGMSGKNPTDFPPNATPARPVLSQQIIIAAARYAHVSMADMRAQRVQEPMIAFVERHRAELQKVYQQQQLQQLAKKNAEQQQQNMANVQLSSMHDQSSMNLPLQRPIGANSMGNASPGDAQMVNGSFLQENGKQMPDQYSQAVAAVIRLKNMFQQRNLPAITTIHIPEEERPEFEQLFDQVQKMALVLDGKLHLYLLVLGSEQRIGKCVVTVMTVEKQRRLLNPAQRQPQYIISLATLRSMQVQLRKLNEDYENHCHAVKASASNATANPHVIASAPLTVPPVQNTSQMTPSVSQTSGRPTQTSQPRPSPSPSQARLQLPPQPPSNQSQSHSLQPSIKKPFPPSPPSSAPPASSAIASPTPRSAAASSSTPATSAPTPQTMGGSPQTPESPPSKAVSRVKSATRRKVSAASKGPATPETVASVVGVKRPAEEDVAALSVGLPEAETSHAPSPKKAKTDWEGEASEAFIKRQQESENIKTDEDAAAFFDRMKELFAMTASTDNEINHDIASTLDQILAGVAQEPADAAATAAALSVHGVGDAGPPPTALSPHLGAANDAFLEFIDFSSFTTLEDEDNDSKATTPDLVSSETNPSPESGSEGDLLGSAGSPGKSRIEDSDRLRLGCFREIDGGESAYYQVDNWKWEGPMPTLDQPWAIFTS